ncbi:substrate-binding periplasmic protein [Aliikangiella maris]|uniref:Transporter substrate-binding domain-containing protein n=2 Tax=Aliikangiella maris TaxID=3162458 RepID=A0ABV2BSC4_9GAMM
MKNSIRYIVTLVIYLVYCQSSIACHIRLRVPTIPYPPTFMLNQQKQWTGVSIEAAQMLMKQANCRLIYVELPFKRALELMRSGQIDMMLNLSKQADRESYIHMIGPQGFEDVVLVTLRNDKNPVNQLEDIKIFSKPVAIELGMYYGENFTTLFQNNAEFREKILVVKNLKQSIQILQANRISGFLTHRGVIVHKIKQNPDLQLFQVNDLIIHRAPIYFGFSKMSVAPHTILRLESAFDKLTKSGLLERHYQRYHQVE